MSREGALPRVVKESFRRLRKSADTLDIAYSELTEKMEDANEVIKGLSEKLDLYGQNFLSCIFK